MFSGIEEQFYFYGRNRSLTTIRGASYKLEGTELNGYVSGFSSNYLGLPKINFSLMGHRDSLRVHKDSWLRGAEGDS
jgi:hypothetical protein